MSSPFCASLVNSPCATLAAVVTRAVPRRDPPSDGTLTFAFPTPGLRQRLPSDGEPLAHGNPRRCVHRRQRHGDDRRGEGHRRQPVVQTTRLPLPPGCVIARCVGLGTASVGAASVLAVRVATWNVNSVKQRVPRLLPWLDQRQPDVVCLQETKLADDAFTELLGDELAAAATRSRCTARRSGTGWRSCPGWGWTTSRSGSPAPRASRTRRRARSPRPAAGSGVHSVYVPNGRVPDSEHYHYKLAWLAALREHGRRRSATATIVCGDMNIAPTDADVFDPDAYVGPDPCHAAGTGGAGPSCRRSACATSSGSGGRTRGCSRTGTTGPECSTKDLGMRIDLVLAPRPVADRVRAAWVDRHARKGTGPSDHAPVIVDLDEAPDGDIGPVVPPPSAPAARPNTVTLPQSR